MKSIITLILTMAFNHAFGQNLTTKNVFSFTPKLNTQINGVGLGLLINSLEYDSDTLTTEINGLNIELIGVGLFLPLIPTDPLIPNGITKRELKGRVLDSLILDLNNPRPYQINGISISLGGLGGHEIKMDGLNISGINTYTSSMNGVSIALFMNYNGQLKGLSIGLLNRTLKTKGIQIGLTNRTEKLKGIQIGLWNKNEKRGLPFINWNFKN